MLINSVKTSDQLVPSAAILDKRGSQPEPLSPTMNAIELVGTESELIPNPDVDQDK